MPILPPFMPLAFLRAEHIPHFWNWPSTAAPVDDRRDGFRGYFRRASGEVARQFVTHQRHEAPVKNMPRESNEAWRVHAAGNQDGSRVIGGRLPSVAQTGFSVELTPGKRTRTHSIKCEPLTRRPRTTRSEQFFKPGGRQHDLSRQT